MILQHHDVFSLQDDEYGRVDIVKHFVNTDDHHPINQTLLRIPYAPRAEMLKTGSGYGRQPHNTAISQSLV